MPKRPMSITVKELVEKLSKVPPDTIVVVPGDDHSYRRIQEDYVQVTTVMQEGGDFYEDHGEQLTPEGECGKRVPAVVIG